MSIKEADELNRKNTGQNSIRLDLAIFALSLIGLGILGLIHSDFARGLEPVPESMPARLALAYLSDVVYLACGAGLLWRRTVLFAARVLFVFFLLWLVLLRVPWMFVSFQIGTWWPAGSAAVMAGTAWILYSSLGNDQDGRFGFVTGDKGVLIARILFGLGLVPLGLAHFLYLEATAPLVPAWLLFPVFWAYFTGAAFIAAGLAIAFNVFARLAAALITIQIACLTVFVWVPRIIAGNMSAFQWNEFVVSILLTAAAWVMADSYRGTLLLGADKIS
ncbi:MAG: DoxX family protein [Acidobacteriota bacterium]